MTYLSDVFKIFVAMIVLFILLILTIILFKLRKLDRRQLHRQGQTDVEVYL